MSARFFCLALLAATSLFASAGALAQGVPPEAYRAKTVFIRNNAGGAQLENAADEELSKWGRFALADDEASADIILIFSKNGIQNTQKSDNKKDGTCCDTSYGASFSPGATARVPEGAWPGTRIAALLAGWLRRHDAEGDRQGLHRCVQETVSAVGPSAAGQKFAALLLVEQCFAPILYGR